MFGLNGREMRFALVISATHLTQHFLMRLIPPLIPVLAVALLYPLWQLGLLLTLFYVGSGLFQAPLGVLADRYDRRYILPTGIAAGGACYVLFAAAPMADTVIPTVTVLGHSFEGGFILMCLAMLGVGIGTAVVHPTGYPMISDNVSEANKGKVLGAFGSSSKLGDAAAPAIIAVLILVLVWDQILVLLGLVGTLFGIVLYFVLRSDEYETMPAGYEDDSERADETADESEFELESRDGRSDAGEASETVWEADKRTYLYPMTVIYVFFITKMFASNGVNTFMPAFLVAVYAYSFEVMDVYFAPESVANFYFAVLLVFAAGTQLVLGGVTDRYDSRVVLLSCVSAATVGLVMLAMLDLGPVLLLLVLLLLGAGIWGLNPARDALISEITPPEREGRTFGYIWTAVMLTGAAIPTIVGYVMEAIGMREGFLLLAIGTILAGLSISLLFSKRIYRPESDPVAHADPSD